MASSLIGNVEITRWLLENGASVNEKTEKAQATALMMAARGGHLEIVEMLVNNGADVDAKTCQGASALTFASNGNHTLVYRYLVSKNAFVNKIDFLLASPLVVEN